MERIHQLIFGHAMSREMGQFIKKLGWSAIGGGMASFISMAVITIYGKYSGPLQFGQYNSFMSVASALSPLFLFGLNISSVRLMADNEKKPDIKNLYTTSIGLFLMQVFIGSLLVLGWYFINPNIRVNIFLVIGVTILISAEALGHSFLRSLGFIRQQALLRVVQMLITAFILIMGVVVFKNTNFLILVYAVGLGAIFFIFSVVIQTHKMTGVFSKKILWELINNNKVLFLVAVASIIWGFEKYVIGKFWGDFMLGLFSMHYMFSFMILASLLVTFMNVFFPATISEKSSLKAIEKKVLKLFLLALPVWLIGDSIGQLIIFNYLIKSYPFETLNVLLFAAASFLYFVFSTYNMLLNISKPLVSSITYLSAVIAIITMIPFSRNINLYLVCQILIYLTATAIMRFSLLKNITPRMMSR